jgi:SAM-dependent methyltransferase
MRRWRNKWEERAKSYGSQFKSVLFRSFPYELNRYIHNWHVKQVLSAIRGVESNKEKVKVLDIGCGYGRLSSQIRHKFPKAIIYGLDISQNFIEEFNKNIARPRYGIIGDMQYLPFKKETFDYIVIVTVLSYLPEGTHKSVMNQTVELLKPQGKCILIEDNRELLRIATFFRFLFGMKDDNINTRQHLFKPLELDGLIRESNGILLQRRGIVFFTFLIPILMVISKINTKLLELVLKISDKLDNVFCKMTRYSIHVSYVFTKFQ